jgi:hypothetical protein
MMRCTRRTSAPGCTTPGGASKSGLLDFPGCVSRDDDDDGGGLLCAEGMGAGVFGSLGPAIPSDEGELSQLGFGGSMEQHVGLIS